MERTRQGVCARDQGRIRPEAQAPLRPEGPGRRANRARHVATPRSAADSLAAADRRSYGLECPVGALVISDRLVEIRPVWDFLSELLVQAAAGALEFSIEGGHRGPFTRHPIRTQHCGAGA